MFQLSAFQSNAFEIGWPRPAGGYIPAPHERVIQLTKPAKIDVVRQEDEPEQIDRSELDGLIADRARSEVARQQLDAMERAALVDQILLLEYHIQDAEDRKRLSSDMALCLLLLADY